MSHTLQALVKEARSQVLAAEDAPEAELKGITDLALQEGAKEQAAMKQQLESRQAALDDLIDQFAKAALLAAEKGEVQRPSERRALQLQHTVGFGQVGEGPGPGAVRGGVRGSWLAGWGGEGGCYADVVPRLLRRLLARLPNHKTQPTPCPPTRLLTCPPACLGSMCTRPVVGKDGPNAWKQMCSWTDLGKEELFLNDSRFDLYLPCGNAHLPAPPVRLGW
ncbi:hypothetical protein HaLaN_09723 [Haematococcus lacustris]|uniref:Uncharacterized protein n=1 Tax=Haematococcus lacustris TaxID=44745 RepID=A0A699YU73_HAELA|nr:hypothetical protein HaLaN_09723 [Haematococcus lacustris]